MKFLLDTSAYSALARGDEKVVAVLRSASSLVVSAVVVGELMHGFRAGAQFEQNVSDLERFLDQPWVEFLPVSWTTADRFGRIASELRKKGRPIPTNDIWIAAHAIESGAELLTRDAHFAEIDGLVWRRP